MSNLKALKLMRWNIDNALILTSDILILLAVVGWALTNILGL